MEVAFTLGLEPSGRESLVVVAKGTFRIPEDGGSVGLADEQMPLTMSDVFDGEPGRCAPVREIDFAPKKHRCDVLLLGSAYAPGGRPIPRVRVGLMIGGMTKRFVVVGNRHWVSRGSVFECSAPEPFTVMQCAYDVAFGGVDDNHPDPAEHSTYLLNPVGCGFHKHLRRAWVEGSSLPNTEETGSPIEQPDGRYLPMAFGPLGRNWEPRWRYAGTYDQQWLDEQFPFPAVDLDDRYFQSAPEDQQIPIPNSGIEVVLENLTSDGLRRFHLPFFEAPVHFFPRVGSRETGSMSLDTIVIEPDQTRVTLTWRISRPLKKDIFEMSTVLVGHKSNAWWRAIDSGKAYYSSLGELAKRSGTD